jgi:hypothetical protein
MENKFNYCIIIIKYLKGPLASIVGDELVKVSVLDELFHVASDRIAAHAVENGQHRHSVVLRIIIRQFALWFFLFFK